MELKVVGKSGQISAGKAMAGMGFIMETLPGGDILLKHSKRSIQITTALTGRNDNHSPPCDWLGGLFHARRLRSCPSTF